MTTPRRSAPSHLPRPLRSEPLQDEVYRQMFRLEASRPGAALDLALALLRAWISADTLPASRDQKHWLQKISPICMEMIESSLHPTPPHSCSH
ncbi:MAG: hypothetical protein KGL64_11360 [Acidobacteriota bacterium]|nr:hypothetical protein [Acidobacteriota bacterium]